MSDEGDRLDSIVEQLYERVDRGEDPDLEETMLAHPEYAEELRKRFDALRLLDRTFACVDLPEGTPRMIGDYRVVQEIGRGGMGVVYEAEEVSMRRRVALKVLTPAISGSDTRDRRST